MGCAARPVILSTAPSRLMQARHGLAANQAVFRASDRIMWALANTRAGGWRVRAVEQQLPPMHMRG